ncbi:hypothetical protein [Sphingomonas xinjiangensis]|uniref:Uncharacterized protein n=1 Tax=Sphingomonas xinjiangensis TaxID=643568 RepID=A0A840YI41_9SPHN|nr:hypothetical protein [Sphingomonas xinjiangensis]MBB5712075.1 hypothetical protein [Sphingomonas xinjiangensis]
MVEIIRIKSIADAQSDPHVEVRDIGAGMFLLSISFGGEGRYLDGPYLSAEAAEQDGVGLAQEQGVTRLHVVHTAAIRQTGR